MSWGLIARLKRWRARRGGAHRSGAIRQGDSGHPSLSIELDAARRRLAHVERLSPVVDRVTARIEVRLNRNHLGPLFDEALGLNPRGRNAP